MKRLVVITVLTSFNLLYPAFPDFFVSMEAHKRFDRKIAQKNARWFTLKKLYDAHIMHGDSSDELRIPKIIHHIWLGSPLPEKYQQLRQTWIEHHPDWKFILWTDKEVAELKLVNQKLYDQATNYGEKSDIARYEILYRFGGLYVDTDFECLKPFDELHYRCDFYTGLNCSTNIYIFNGIIGSCPEHPILKQCVETMQHDIAAPKHVSKSHHGTLYRTGPYFFTKIIMDHVAHCSDRTVILPPTFFYPWPFFVKKEKERDKIMKWIKPESFAIHHWHVSWISKK